MPARCPSSTLLILAAALALALAQAGCGGSGPKVVVYSALDREFAKPVLDDYRKRAGVAVEALYDAESTKTVGLTQRIIAEAGRDPQCDLFWNNEILQTLRLKRKGLLRPFRPSHAADFPEEYRAKDGTWYGFAARARVLLVHTDLVAEADRPKGLKDLVDPRWKGKIGLAKPLFGTTATHAACLFEAWGDEKAKAFFAALKANGAQVLSGNKGVAVGVGKGDLAFGLTDTDDAMEEVDAGHHVLIVYPDREPGGLGTLFIPNTLAIPGGAPRPKEAEALADHLLSPEVEAALASGPGAQIPLGSRTSVKAKVETPKTVPAMKVDFEAAAARWDEVSAYLTREFAGR